MHDGAKFFSQVAGIPVAGAASNRKNPNLLELCASYSPYRLQAIEHSGAASDRSHS